MRMRRPARILPHDPSRKGRNVLDLVTWTPAGLFFGIVGIVTVPFLGVLVVLTVALGALVAIAGAILMSLYWLVQTADRRWRKPGETAQPASIRVSAQTSLPGRIR